MKLKSGNKTEIVHSRKCLRSETEKVGAKRRFEGNLKWRSSGSDFWWFCKEKCVEEEKVCFTKMKL